MAIQITGIELMFAKLSVLYHYLDYDDLISMELQHDQREIQTFTLSIYFALWRADVD
jgi:hypothetical protein